MCGECSGIAAQTNIQSEISESLIAGSQWAVKPFNRVLLE